MKILAIETSCDETAAAVVENGTKIISNVIASSAEMHKKYGGIVPEIAAREQLRCVIPVLTEACPSLTTVDAIAVAIGPGLVGSLLIGVETAKTIAFATGKPIIPVNHVLAHMYANFLDSNRENSSRAQSRDNLIGFPAISLVVSGGHTELYLMKSVKELTWLGGTLDDAAGECFDKTARLLGFENRGGVAIEEAAKKCKVPSAKCKVKLPRPMLDDSFNFSFSGLKTAVLREWRKCHPGQFGPELTAEGLDPGSSSKIDSGSTAGMTNAFAFEVQEAITDVLVKKTLRAAQKHQAKSILLSGGVAANSRLREKFSILHSQFSIHVPPAQLCTDNAVAIASYAFFRGEPTDWHEITAVPDVSVEF